MRSRRAAVLGVALATGLGTVGTPATAGADTDPVPVIQISPNPPLDSREVRVFGRDFCGDPACTTVTVTLDGRVLRDAVVVEGDGRFVTDLFLQTMPGEHEVVATQEAADGTRLRASSTVTVPAVDYIEDRPSSESPPAPGSPDPSTTSERSLTDANRDRDPGAAGPVPTDTLPVMTPSASDPLPPSTSPMAAVTEENDGPLRRWAVGLLLVAAGATVARVASRRRSRA